MSMGERDVFLLVVGMLLILVALAVGEAVRLMRSVHVLLREMRPDVQLAANAARQQQRGGNG